MSASASGRGRIKRFSFKSWSSDLSDLGYWRLSRNPRSKTGDPGAEEQVREWRKSISGGMTWRESKGQRPRLLAGEEEGGVKERNS